MAARKGGLRAPKTESRMGKHASPRRQLLASPEQFGSWDREAARLGLTWAEWARQVLDGALPPGSILARMARERLAKLRAQKP